MTNLQKLISKALPAGRVRYLLTNQQSNNVWKHSAKKKIIIIIMFGNCVNKQNACINFEHQFRLVKRTPPKLKTTIVNANYNLFDVN